MLVALGSDPAQGTNPGNTINRWLQALRAKSASQFEKTTTIPFTFLTTNHPKHRPCDGTAKDEKRRAQMFACILNDEKLLVDELASFEFEGEPDFMSQFDLKPFDPKHSDERADLRRRARPLAKSGDSLFHFHFVGNGIVYYFVIALRGDRVSGVAMDVTFFD